RSANGCVSSSGSSRPSSPTASLEPTPYMPMLFLSARRPAAAVRRSVLVLRLLATGLAVPNAFAQTTVPEIPANVVNLSAGVRLEVPQGWLTVVLNTPREGSDAVTVQNQLRQAVEAALALAQPQARPQQLEVRTGNLRLYPRSSRAGRIGGWQGQAEV